jgi:hypothetical protein
VLVWTRKQGSQRRSKLRPVRVEPNYGGQGGLPYMAFFDCLRDEWICIQPESVKEVRELQSQAAILALNVKDDTNG